jgi:lysozyme
MANKTSELGLRLIRHYESLHDGDLSQIGLQPKMDPRGIWTEGWGHAIVYKGKFLTGKENKALAYQLSIIHTEEEADRHLAIDIAPIENSVNALLPNLPQWQFDALVSFCYNLGYGRLLTSTVLKRIRNKQSAVSITEAWCWFNLSDGKVLPGLTYRRQSEAFLFNNNQLKFFNTAA